jgi:hypothetical protein
MRCGKSKTMKNEGRLLCKFDEGVSMKGYHEMTIAALF